MSQLVPGTGPLSPGFGALLAIHVLAGLTCVVAGAVAAMSRKQPGRHPRAGQIYFWALSVVFVTATVMAIFRWSRDYHLFVLGAIAFTLGSLGYAARKVRWTGWTTIYVGGMGLSYIVLLTAFYVDNGPNLPLWNHLPTAAFWIGPSLIGVPIVARALVRYTHVLADLRDTCRGIGHALSRPRRQKER